MGLISKTVKVKWSRSNKKYYEELGYTFTRCKEEFEVKVEHLPKNSNIKVECFCDNCGKTLPLRKYQDYNRYLKEGNKSYCKKCGRLLFGNKTQIQNKLKNSKSFYDWCVENNKQDIIDRWDYELNGCKPSEICYKTSKKYWFKCGKHKWHKSELKSIVNFVSGHEGCMNCKQCNSIAQWFIDNKLNINDYWDYEKNSVDPWEISYRSDSINIWIFCQEKDYHGSYETNCYSFTNGARCSYCGNCKVHPLDSLKQHIVEKYGEKFFNIIWSDKNSVNPTTLKPNSTIKCWWNCPDGKHKPFKRSCNHSYRLDFRCPECSKERNESMIEEKVRLYLEELGYEVRTEYKCSLIPYNPKTNYPLPFDNEIVLENGQHLIIEVHGSQHYKSDFYKTRLTQEEAENKLKERKNRDKYKKEQCIQAGYEYLEIPYMAFKNESSKYKKIIDDKIKEILNKK